MYAKLLAITAGPKLQVAIHYGVEEELRQCIDVSCEQMCAEGLIDRS